MSPFITNPAQFDGNLFSDVPGLTVLATNPYIPARRRVTISEIARTDKSKVTGGFYNSKPILVRVGITRVDRDTLEQSIDTLMSNIQGIEKQLIVRQSGAMRRYTATFSNSIVSKDGGSYAELDLIFETSDHFGYEVTSTLLAQVNGFTSGQKTTQISVAGSAQWQAPIITISFTSITTGTDRTVTIGNDSTGQAIVIQRNWSSNETLVINTETNDVQVNGVDVEWSGAMPLWQKGTGYISYSDTFTARTFGLNMVYYKRYV